jgi:hypothetical protein
MSDAPTIDRPKARKRALRKLNAAQRRRIEVAVEAMIEALNEIDGDENLEPSLGYQPGRHVDVEDEHDGREPDTDGEEPSLGSFDRMTDQRKSWRQAEIPGFRGVDAEHDPAEGREGDDERERDEAEESGIGDAAGLSEQLSRHYADACYCYDYDREADPADAKLLTHLVNGAIRAD